MDKYIPLEVIGRGSHGNVYRCVCEDTKKHFAMKITDSRDNLINFEREKKFYETVPKHENIVSIVDFVEERRAIVMELFEGVTIDKFSKSCFLINNDFEIILKQCINGLQHIHNHKMVHRDVKSENIMISRTKPYKIKYIDFNFCSTEEDLKKEKKPVGSPLYEPLNTLNGNIDFQSYVYSDIWGLNVSMHELITGDVPYNGFNLFNLKQNLMSQPTRHSIKYPINNVGLIRSMFESSFQLHSRTRVSLSEMKCFIKNTEDLINIDHVGVRPKQWLERLLQNIPEFTYEDSKLTAMVENRKYDIHQLCKIHDNDMRNLNLFNLDKCVIVISSLIK